MPGAERIRKALSVELLAILQQYVISQASHTFVPTLVHQFHHNVYLIHSSAVKVLADICSKLLFGYTSLIFPPSHRRRLSSNPRIYQQRLVER
jgi:hypothetical protein